MRNLHSALRVGLPYVTSIFRVRTADRDMGIRASVGREVHQCHQKTTGIIGRKTLLQSGCLYATQQTWGMKNRSRLWEHAQTPASVQSGFALLNGILHVGFGRCNQNLQFGQIYSRVDGCQVGPRSLRVRVHGRKSRSVLEKPALASFRTQTREAWKPPAPTGALPHGSTHP